MTELKPCPFCGADPIHLTVETDDGGAFIYCATCDMIVEHAYPGMSKEELITHWNRRAEE